MGTSSREAAVHASWLGMVQPDGLVVSVPVLEEAGVYVRQPTSKQDDLRAFTEDDVLPGIGPLLDWLGWPLDYRAGPERIASEWTLDLPDLGATLRPTAVAQDGAGPLLFVLWTAGDMDDAGDRKWPASAQERFERLLVAKGVALGLHVSPDAVRLTYAPAGEAPGRLTFPVVGLRAVDGRVLVDALLMLLGVPRLWSGPADKRLLALVQASRKRQEAVTVALAEQVEDALRVLLAGFDAAAKRPGGAVLREVDDEAVYGGLTTVILRLVFLLYAEDRALLPVDHPVFAENYSVTALAEQLAADAVRHTGSMDRRHGAWGRLLTLFRVMYTGAAWRDLWMPPRKGDLFDPGRYPFLEGRRTETWQQEAASVPPFDDGTIHTVLQRLLYLEGQRISYRNLEVEQIGSVYEALMGFVVVRVGGPTVALKPDGALVALRELRESERPIEFLANALGEKPAKVKTRFGGVVAFEATDDEDGDIERLRALLAPQTRGPVLMVGEHGLQLGAARRSSGSHYTPRSLTEPIVARTLGPVLESDGPTTPERILELRVCDPAMGSGAFLAEACRYLAKRLVEAWGRTGTTPPAATDSHDPEMHARRLVAERCLYGVDKNPRAVQLARLSMWLVTSARDLPFTFVDHALKLGDALVGLDAEQIASFSFERRVNLWTGVVKAAMQSASRTRAQITAAQLSLLSGHDQKRTYLTMADEEVWDEARLGDALLGATWAGGTKSELKARVARVGDFMRLWYPNPNHEPMPTEAEALVADIRKLRPFHWELEFPEVFVRKNGGFDCVIGNPPFGGKNTISSADGAAYIPMLQALWPHAHGNSDLCAYFFLRATDVLRKGGTFGLVATNTIGQGDTRDTGLKHLVEKGGVTLYDATVDLVWPLAGAAVVVDVVHGAKGKWNGAIRLGGIDVGGLSSALTAGEELADPVPLRENEGRAFIGSYVLGMGFTLTPEEAAELIERDPHNAEVIQPYIGGEELNSNPRLEHERYVINFRDWPLEKAEEWPELIAIVREKVKPERDRLTEDRSREIWWQFSRRRPELYAAMERLPRVLVCARHSKHVGIAFQPPTRVYSEATCVFLFEDAAALALLQSSTHDAWARALGSSLKADLRYTPSTCFGTFPFPRPTAAQRITLAEAGQALYDARSALMLREELGMTKVWNRVLDPHEMDPDFLHLRAVRDAMDRAVLAAYGWSDIDAEDKATILTRLRALNAQRAAEERRRG